MPKKEIRYVPPKEKQRMISDTNVAVVIEGATSDATADSHNSDSTKSSAASADTNTTKHLRRQLENLRRRYVALLAWYSVVSLIVVIIIGFSYNDMTALGVGLILFGVPFFYLFMVEEPLHLSD